MHRRFIAIVVSAALTITGMAAAPARAGDDDIAKWIAGAAALAIVGAAISEHESKKRKRRAIRQQQQLQQYYDNHGYTDVDPRPNPWHGKLLPASCRVTKRLHGQKIRGFGRHCLKRNNVNVRALPQECAYRIKRNDGRKRVIFGSRCLRDFGYQVADAR